MIYPLMVLDIEVVADYPGEAYVLAGVSFDFGAKTGTLSVSSDVDIVVSDDTVEISVE